MSFTFTTAIPPIITSNVTILVFPLHNCPINGEIKNLNPYGQFFPTNLRQVEVNYCRNSRVVEDDFGLKTGWKS